MMLFLKSIYLFWRSWSYQRHMRASLNLRAVELVAARAKDVHTCLTAILP